MKNCHLSKSDYELIKSQVGMRSAAEFYGYPVDRQGRCLCPFHNDQRPSMKIYPHDKGYYCFSCGNGGDVIKFVGRLYGMNNEQAAKKLIEDFSLPIKTEGLSYREMREKEKKIRKQEDLRKFYQDAHAVLSIYRQLLCDASRDFANLHFDEALQNLSLVEYQISCLEEDPAGFMEDRKVVKKLGEIRERINHWDE